VLGAIVLGVTAVVFFGLIRLFSESEEFVLYFDEQVGGLEVGASVKFRGISIGSVTKIYIRFNQSIDSDAIPVIIELDVSLLPELGVNVDLKDEEQFNEIINLGYRARLVTENFITGLKYIEIDIEGDTGRPVFYQEKVIYKEFPTKPSLTATLSQIMDDVLSRFDEIDITGISKNLAGFLESARNGIDEIEFARLNESFASAAESAKDLLESPEIRKAIDNINSTLAEYEGLAADVRAKIDPVLDKAEETNLRLQTTLATIENVAAELELMLTPESVFRYQLDRTLVELEQTLASARMLVEQLERSPKSLLTGKELPASENRSKKKEK